MPTALPILPSDDIAREEASHREALGNLEALHQDGIVPGGWWHREGDRVACDLCPRQCVMKPGDRGFCFVRQNIGGQMMLTTYGRSTGFCIDPVEKKPLNHFLPGTSVLSFGTAGCNLGCKFCQNWDISKSREVERLSQRALPDEVARAASEMGCHSVAYTYNDPVIWAEYAIDTAKACRDRGIKSVAVTAGYITKEARGDFYQFMDAANVDLKAFTEEFYYRMTLSHLQPVLDTLKWLKHETDVWFEITNLVIPQANDELDEFRQMSDWILQNVGDEVPVHFTAFHPDYRMLDRPDTPPEILAQARDMALQTGLKYVYVGNVNDVRRQSTYCPNCQRLVIERNWYELGVYALDGNQCRYCGTKIAGVFLDKPGNWGRKRQPVDMRRFHSEDRQRTLELPERPGVEGEKGRGREGEKNRNDSSHSALPLAPSPPPPLASSPAAAQPKGRSAMQIPTQAPNLTPEQRKMLLATAAELIMAASEGRAPRTPEFDRSGLPLRILAGSFVSLKRRGRLRSCCGSFGQAMQLGQCLKEAANRTATNDPRFPKVSPSEFPHLDIDVWLLFAPEQLTERGEDRIKAVTIGKHGLQIIGGDKRGLLLPGVATDNGWNSEEFLNQVCVKAGLPPTAWKSDDTILFRYEGDVTHGPLVSGGQQPTDSDVDNPARGVLLSEFEFGRLAEFCRQTLTAMIQGLTPLYYCPGVPDADVHGVAVLVTLPGSNFWLSSSRLSSKEKYPLQSTLSSQCETLAKALQPRGISADKLQVDIIVLDDTAMHGTVADPDLDGIVPATRGVLVSERNRQALVFDRKLSPEQLVHDASQLVQMVNAEWSQLFSLRALCTRDRFTIEMTPKPAAGADVRPPAVAGKFYPGDAAGVAVELDRMLGLGDEGDERERGGA